MTITYSPDHPGQLIVEATGNPGLTIEIPGVSRASAEAAIRDLLASKPTQVLSDSGQLWAINGMTWRAARWSPEESKS